MKPLLCILFLYTLVSPAIAQKSWELRMNAGYDFSTASQYLLDQINNNMNAYSSRSVNSSFGRGLGFGGDVTCWINRYFGFMAGGSYHIMTPPVKGYAYNNFIDAGSSSNSTWHSSTALAIAGIALKVPDTRLHPYARMSLVLPVYSHIREDADWSSWGWGGSTQGQYKKTYRLRNTAGYTAAIGIAPALNKRLALFAEINIQSLAALARRSTLTSYTQNGVEKINTYKTIQKETRYVKKMDGNFPYNENEPLEELTFSFPYSSIGIHAGVSIKL